MVVTAIFIISYLYAWKLVPIRCVKESRDWSGKRVAAEECQRSFPGMKGSRGEAGWHATVPKAMFPSTSAPWARLAMAWLEGKLCHRFPSLRDGKHTVPEHNIHLWPSLQKPAPQRCSDGVGSIL